MRRKKLALRETRRDRVGEPNAPAVALRYRTKARFNIKQGAVHAAIEQHRRIDALARVAAGQHSDLRIGQAREVDDVPARCGGDPPDVNGGNLRA